MRLSNRSLAVGTALGLSIFGAGCGETNVTVDVKGPVRGPALGSPYPGILRCVAQTPEKWQPTPENANVAAIADVLKVSPGQVVNGQWGPATCHEAIKASQVGSKASVRGIGSMCVVVGLQAESVPDPDTTHRDVLAVCASESV